ncbi:hypothetical protein BJX76DRAFT_348559 [Aspergillus varians]
MGSSLSLLQSKDKRRRSNRLSKPPQNQATPICPASRSPLQPTEQTLSLPSTPTAWQNPWTGISVPMSPSDIVSPNPRSQSFSSKPLRREATWKSNGPPVAQRSAHGTAEIWPQAPTPAPSRRGSMYGRASFHPSEIATFQPTTLQSNPQSPLMGQPKRSYSVHSPSQKSKNGVQRPTLDMFASVNSHSRVNSQDSLPTRRRSLLIRPGVATRKTTKSISPTFLSGPYENCTVSPGPHDASFKPTRSPFLPHEDIIFNDYEPLSQLRPPTPSDFGYTHLGALKLGSLRIVNGSASPCSSDRTRLGRAGSPTPEAILDNVNSTDLLPSVETGNVSRPTSPGGLGFAKYNSILDNATGLDHDRGNLPSATDVPAGNMPCYQVTSGGSDVPATMLNIPPVPAARVDIDLPASPFSFDESPTSISGQRAELRGAQDEGISVHGKERAPIPILEKVPERHLSYSSCASSHRKVDSGYSSATSHRTSIDSHASLRRSPGFRRLTLGDSPRDLELRDMNTYPRTGNQPPMNHHFILQDQKLHYRQDICERPTSLSSVQRGRPQLQVNDHLRGSSLPLPKPSGRALSPPLYCAQLRNLESATSKSSSSTSPHMNDFKTGQVDESLYWSYGLEGSSYPYSATLPASIGCGFRGEINQGAGFSRHTTALPTSHPASHSQHNDSIKEYREKSEDGNPRESQTSDAIRQYRRYSSGVNPEIWLPLSMNDILPSIRAAEQPSNGIFAEPPRGRARSRSIGYQHRRTSGQQPLYFTEVYA